MRPINHQFIGFFLCSLKNLRKLLKIFVCLLYIIKNKNLYKMKLNNWIKVTGDEILPAEVNFINCDTRDFHCILSTEIPNKYTEETAVNAGEKYRISADYVIDFIIDLKQKTGGDGEWRHIELKDGYRGDRWLKYIWFVRCNEDDFVMMTRECGLLEPSKLLEMIDWSNPYVMAE